MRSYNNSLCTGQITVLHPGFSDSAPITTNRYGEWNPLQPEEADENGYVSLLSVVSVRSRKRNVF